MAKMFKKKKSNKCFAVKVSTMDADIRFTLNAKATGKELFDSVTQTIGLREVWYFGLQFQDSKGGISWLKMHRKVRDQDIDQSQHVLHFLFLVKFYPEDVTEDLVQGITQHLFFLQVKHSILSMDVHCPAEAAVLLASYAIQAKYGDYDECAHQPLVIEDLLPQEVIDRYKLTREMWEERIRVWYADHQGMTREEARMEYLKIAQDLDMYGVSYFPIFAKEDIKLWLGVTNRGLSIYDEHNKLKPKVMLPWSNICIVSMDNKKFNINTVEKSSPNFTFFSKKLRMNKAIMDLCKGNHMLYMRRRMAYPMDIQQMKAQAREEKDRWWLERAKMMREKKLREELRNENIALEKNLIEYQREICAIKEDLQHSEESGDLLAEKSMIAEHETLVMQQKAAEADDKLRREVNQLKRDVENAREAEQEAKDTVAAFLSALCPSTAPNDSSALSTPSCYHSMVQRSQSQSTAAAAVVLITESALQDLSLEIEQERSEYIEKSQILQEDLFALTMKIEQLKVEEKRLSCTTISECGT